MPVRSVVGRLVTVITGPRPPSRFAGDLHGGIALQ